MGFECEVKKIFALIYKANVGNNLTEYEYDHVFIGKWEGVPKPNPEEVCEWKWVSIEEIEKDIKKNPEKYAPWFRIIFPKVIEYIKNKKQNFI